MERMGQERGVCRMGEKRQCSEWKYTWKGWDKRGGGMQYGREETMFGMEVYMERMGQEGEGMQDRREETIFGMEVFMERVRGREDVRDGKTGYKEK